MSEQRPHTPTSPEAADPAANRSLDISSNSPQALSKVDKAWLRMDEPTNLMIITGVMLFSESLALDDLRLVLQRRLLRVARFRQRVVLEPGQPERWEEVENLDLDQHLQTLSLGPNAGKPELEAKVGELMSEPLGTELPLWRIDLVEGYQGGSAVITRLHHAIADGVALMMVLLSLADLHPEHSDEANPLSLLFKPDAQVTDEHLEHARQLLPEVMQLMTRFTPAQRARADQQRDRVAANSTEREDPRAFSPEAKQADSEQNGAERSAGASGAATSEHKSGKRRRGRGPLRTAARASVDLARLVFQLPDPKTPFKGPLTASKRAAWSQRVPMEEVREIKSYLGGTVNDVLITAITGGLRRYLLARGDSLDGLNIRATVPVSLRPLDRLRDMGNHFGLVFLPLPLGLEEPSQRLAELRRRMDRLKKSLEAGLVLMMLRGVGYAPRRVQDVVVKIFGTKATAVLTNVPGPRRTLYLAGRAIRDMLFWVPQAGRVGLGISIFSYDGQVRVGITTDASLVDDPHQIVDSFHREHESLLKKARGQ